MVPALTISVNDVGDEVLPVLYILGSLRVLGDVYTGNINVTGLLNGIPVSAFLNRYKYLGEGRHELRGNPYFNV